VCVRAGLLQYLQDGDMYSKNRQLIRYDTMGCGGCEKRLSYKPLPPGPETTLDTTPETVQCWTNYLMSEMEARLMSIGDGVLSAVPRSMCGTDATTLSTEPRRELELAACADESCCCRPWCRSDGCGGAADTICCGSSDAIDCCAATAAAATAAAATVILSLR